MLYRTIISLGLYHFITAYKAQTQKGNTVNEKNLYYSASQKDNVFNYSHATLDYKRCFVTNLHSKTVLSSLCLKNEVKFLRTNCCYIVTITGSTVTSGPEW